MTRFATEIICFAAYGLFLLGAAGSFRDNGSRRSVLLMTIGVLAYVNTFLLPVNGTSILQLSLTGSNPVLFFAAILGVLTVWLPFPAALILWRRGSQAVFHFMVAAIEICWFAAVVLLVYGLYRFPAG